MKRKHPLKAPEKIELDTGEELAAQFQLHAWDYIIAGDGSATTWDNTAGFGTILYCRKNGVRRRFFGGLSCATNNVAELMAVLAPLLYLEGTLDLKNWIPNVYIFSDSKYVVNTGNLEYSPKSNQALWKSIEHLRTQLNLIFIHVNRMLLPANVFGDQIGNTIRVDFQQFSNQLDTLYFVNPNVKDKDSK